MDGRVGWSVRGYAAEELIGYGGSGEVWRGRSVRTGEIVALKRLRLGAEGAAGSDGVSDVRREASLLAALDHPHLLRVHEVVEGPRPVLVLDYAAGGSLAMLLRARGLLRAGEVVSVVAPLAAALSYAHDEGLVHGDVTPANVLFSADGRPLLADLGVARVAGEEPDPRSTPEYVDPAVAAGAAPGPASDVFMLAGVALHALTGAPPWPGAGPEESLRLASLGQLPDLRPLVAVAPPPLARVLRRALSPHPAERGSAAELALDIRHACAPEPVVPRAEVGSTEPVGHDAPSPLSPPASGERAASAAGQAGGTPWSPPDPAFGGALTHVVRVPRDRRDDGKDSEAPGGPRHRRAAVRSRLAGMVSRRSSARGAGGAPAGARFAQDLRGGHRDPQDRGAAAGSRTTPAPAGHRPRWRVGGLSVLVLAVLGGSGWMWFGLRERPASAAMPPPSVASSGRAADTAVPPGGPAPPVTTARAGRSWPGASVDGGSRSGAAAIPLPAAGAGAGAARSSREVRWVARLDALDGRRALAYERGDGDLLRQVYAPGEHLSVDLRQLDALVRVGETVRGVRHRFGAVVVLAEGPRRARLRVVQFLQPSLRLRAGRVVGTVPGTAPTAIEVELVLAQHGWRLA